MIFPPNIGVTKLMHNEYRFRDTCDENNKILVVTRNASDRSALSTTPALATSFLETAQNSAAQDFLMLTTAGASAIISRPNTTIELLSVFTAAITVVTSPLLSQPH
jgi:hypothetical protein